MWINCETFVYNDEIRFKTPDALMNGEGVVEVIQSCVPSIKDAWQVKSYDLDTILIAIRIATYGETMDINFTVPIANEQASHTLNLPAILEEIQRQEIKNECKTLGLKCLSIPLDKEKSVLFSKKKSLDLLKIRIKKLCDVLQDNK